MGTRSKPDPCRAPNEPARQFRLGFWHVLFFLLGAVAAVLIVTAMPTKGRKPWPGEAVPSRAPSPVPAWGQLDYTTIELERPEESFPATTPPPDPIAWWLTEPARAQLEAVVASSDLPAATKAQLLDKSHWNSFSNLWQLRPPLEAVRDMSTPTRKAMYRVLSAFPQNLYLRNPVRLAASGFDKWVSTAGVSPTNQALLRRLAVPEGDMVYFYDSQVMEWVCTPTERKSMAKAVTRTPALLMKLRVGPDSDIDALVRYWGQGSHGLAMKPFLESLARVPGGTDVGISFFFPTFPRLRLYTYPDPKNDRMVWHQDCFWTAMNFFSETPDARFFNPDEIQAVLNRDYSRVSGDYAFGDVILLADPATRQALHMCVYVADDVVFTKNGASHLAPWVLMKLPEMLRQYPSPTPLQVTVYRRKSARGA